MTNPTPRELIARWRNKIVTRGGGGWGNPIEVVPSMPHIECADELESSLSEWEKPIADTALELGQKQGLMDCANGYSGDLPTVESVLAEAARKAGK